MQVESPDEDDAVNGSQAAPGDATARKRTTGDKVLIGCGLGCAGFVLLGFVLFAIGAWWAVTPGQQVATDELVGDDSLGKIKVEGLADDPGTRALLDRFLGRLEGMNRDRQREELPESMRWLVDLQGGTGSSSSALRMFMPKDVTVAFERPSGGKPGDDEIDDDEIDAAAEVVVAVNFKALVRPIRFALEQAAKKSAEAEQYRGHTIGIGDDGSAFGFVGGTFVYAESREAIRRAIDRAEDGATGTTSRPRRATIPEGDWDLVGLLSDEERLLSKALELGEGDGAEPPAEPFPAELAFGIDVVSADLVAGRAVLEASSPEAAERWRERLAERWTELAEEAAEEGLDLAWTAVTHGNRVDAELRLTGLEAAADRLLDTLDEATAQSR